MCSLALAAMALGAVAAATDNTLAGVACSAGCLAGIFLTPDLDQQTLSHSEHLLVRWTFGLGYGWVLLWYPYARLIPHRSPLSHFPILGTLGRLLYLAFWLCLPALWGWKWFTLPTHLDALWLWAAGGLALSDLGHYVFDLPWCPRAWRR